MKLIAILVCCLATFCSSLPRQATPVTASADVKAAYTTSSTIFLPSALFDPLPRPQNVTGQFATTGDTTYYSLTYELGTRYFNPNHVPLTVGGYDTFVFTASADGTLYALPQETTVTCGPTNGCGTAACKTQFPGVAATTNFDGPSAWLVENAESSVYLAYFTSTAPFPETTTSTAASSTCPGLSAVTSSTARRGSLSPEAKVGIGLGAPLGVCACALMGVLLLLGCRRRRQRSCVGRVKAEDWSDGVAGDGEDKMKRGGADAGDSGNVAELHGAGMLGCQNELEAGFPMVQSTVDY